VAKLLKEGRLNDLRLLSILSPLSDFILNSTPRPDTTEVKTWQRDLSRPWGRDLLPLQRFSDMSRALLGQPGKSLEENLRQGTAYVTTRRQRVEIPEGYGKEEAERITIVLYDTSGSMGGNPGEFQAGLISAFTARALSDIAPSGKHRHRVVIVPFDGAPGVPVAVTNTQEALDILRNYQSKFANTGGGTDIQKALLQAMSLIADAEKRAGEPLAAANIVLMTDGQSAIDPNELLRARKAIDRQTPLQTMFIAINNTNMDLMEFAMDSRSMGAERGFYREFTSEHIGDILNEARGLDISKFKDAFFTEQAAREIPGEIYALMDQAQRLASRYMDQIYNGSRYLPAREHLEELEKIKWHDIKQMDRPLEQWIVKLRNFFLHPVFSDRRVLERVVDDLMGNLDGLTGIKTNQLSDREQEQLRHLVRYAAGLETAQ
jgi:Mg-chelatase subunit ChlD